METKSDVLHKCTVSWKSTVTQKWAKIQQKACCHEVINLNFVFLSEGFVKLQYSESEWDCDCMIYVDMYLRAIRTS